MEETSTKVNKAKNKEILKELTRYSKSDEFNSFAAFCNEKVTELDRQINKEIIERTTIDINGSYVTELMAQIGAIEDMASKCENKIFSAWLKERAERFRSQIYNDCDRTEKLTFSRLDILKITKAQYNAGDKFYLPYCIDLYKDLKEVDYFRQQDPYSF